MAEDTIDEDAPLCTRCLRSTPATVRAAWAAAGVGLTLLVCAVPIGTAYAVHHGPAFLRSAETVPCLLLSALAVGVSALLGAAACFTEAKR